MFNWVLRISRFVCRSTDLSCILLNLKGGKSSCQKLVISCEKFKLVEQLLVSEQADIIIIVIIIVEVCDPNLRCYCLESSRYDQIWRKLILRFFGCWVIGLLYMRSFFVAVNSLLVNFFFSSRGFYILPEFFM